MKKKLPTKKLKKILNSRIVVLLVTVIIFAAGCFLTHTSADEFSSYQFGSVYQYYMLDNRAEAIKNQAKSPTNDKVPLVGQIGTGGIVGSFSYDDIVSSAPKDVKDAKQMAKDFASMMATYSTFNYITNDIYGFDSVSTHAKRALVGLILFPSAILNDIFGLLYSGILAIVVKFNVFTFLSNIVTHTKFASSLETALGMSAKDLETLSNSILGIFCIFFLISLVRVLYGLTRKNNYRATSRLKGQIITFIVLPLSVGLAGSMISMIPELTPNSMTQASTGFQRYFVDDRSWADNFNFAPRGSGSKNSDIHPSHHNSYVDLKFDPYTSDGAERIKDINQYSSLMGNGSVVKGEDNKLSKSDLFSLFSDTSTLYVYASGKTFSASDYINYKGTQEAETQLLGGGNMAKTVGAYYNYANNMNSNNTLLDVKNAYTGSGNKASSLSPDGPFKKSIKDYDIGNDNKHKLNTSPSEAWRDRYIYGVKNFGDLGSYYGVNPSEEMLHTTVGAGESGNSLSDQTMFLALSTIFDETGGRYYIDAPARGISKYKPSFDSNRSKYYVVSMVGNIASVIGMFAQPLIHLIVIWSIVAALLAIGLIDMNIRPLAAFVKAALTGQIEYLGMFLIYLAGFVGNIFCFTFMAGFIDKFFTAVSGTLLATPLLVGWTPTNPYNSMSYNGLRIEIAAAFSIVTFLFFIKDKKFQSRFISLFTLVWEWAKNAADRLELQANPHGISNHQLMRNKIYNLDGHLKNMLPQKLQQNIEGNLSKHQKTHSKKYGSHNETGNLANTPTDPRIIERNGLISRMQNSIGEIGNEPYANKKVANAAQKSSNSMNNLQNNFNLKNLQDSQQQLEQLRAQMQKDGYSKAAIKQIDDSIADLQRIGQEQGLITGTSPHYQSNQADHMPVKNPKDLDKRDLRTDDLATFRRRAEETGTENIKKSQQTNTPKENDSSASKNASRDFNPGNDSLKIKNPQTIIQPVDTKFVGNKKSPLTQFDESAVPPRNVNTPNSLSDNNSAADLSRQATSSGNTNNHSLNNEHSEQKPDKKESNFYQTINKSYNTNPNPHAVNADSMASQRNINSSNHHYETPNRPSSNRTDHLSKDASKIRVQQDRLNSVRGVKNAHDLPNHSWSPSRSNSTPITKNSVVNNINNNNSVTHNTSKVINNTQLRNLSNSLGKAVGDPSIKQILSKLHKIDNKKEFNALSNQLRKNVNGLDEQIKSSVNGKLLADNLHSISKKIK